MERPAKVALRLIPNRPAQYAGQHDFVARTRPQPGRWLNAYGERLRVVDRCVAQRCSRSFAQHLNVAQLGRANGCIVYGRYGHIARHDLSVVGCGNDRRNRGYSSLKAE